MADEESPLVKALPPETDYISYLTIVEQYLTEDNLPVFHNILQDEKLTTNIGWDLVHILVPLLPKSQECLQDIARLGNPREVILKVTESLRLIDYEGLEDASDETEDTGHPQLLKTAPTEDGKSRPGSSQAVELPPPLPLPISQFTALLSMLAILHTRIKTKAPSRFLSGTLQAILASFSNAVSHREEMVLAIVQTVKTMVGVQRPSLPTRKSSGMLSNPERFSGAPRNAADPEGKAGTQSSPEESALQTKLLQSFITHVLEEYLLNLIDYDDVPGMAWCTRIMERAHPERIIPHTTTLADRFSAEAKLQRRIEAVGQIVALAKDLNIFDKDLLAATLTQEALPDGQGSEDDPPASAADIPLSRLGSLLLYAARQASRYLHDRPFADSVDFPSIFPEHHNIVSNCLASPEQGTGQLGTEPSALIDATLALGLMALENDAIGEPTSDETFTSYLQLTALLSSNCPSPNLRQHAHYLTSTVLRSQPDETVRLSFIRDTLEHCPFENLKVSAVGWIKGETIEANPPTPMPHAGIDHDHDASSGATTPRSIFATPLALDSLSPFLFPSVGVDLLSQPIAEAWPTFQANVSFYLASLNFLYLLLSARHLHAALAVSDMWKDNDVGGSFLQPLREAGERFRGAVTQGGELQNEVGEGSGREEVLAELEVLSEGIERVTAAVKFLNETA